MPKELTQKEQEYSHSFNNIKRYANKTGIYVSRTNMGYCKNDHCDNRRRDGSAYCQDCSDFHNE